MPDSAVTVVTGARLHFGLMAPAGAGERAFGGCGMMIDEPRTELTVRPAESDEVLVPEGADATDVRNAAEGLRDRLRHSTELGPLRITIRRHAPRHAGLGSGTQLGEALARAIGELVGSTIASGRGRRSGIGVHGFGLGGFLVDGGRTGGDTVAPLVDRVDVPDEWRIVLASPLGVKGVAGTAENAAFDALDGTADARATAMRGRIETDVLPALRTSDFDRFARAIGEYGRDAGRAFAEVQGGLFTHSSTAEVVAWWTARGLAGTGQTSWGPTAFAFVPNDDEARVIADETGGEFGNVDVRVVRPRNRGATCAVVAD